MTRYRQRAATTHRFDATRNNTNHSPNLNAEQDQQNDEDKGLYASEYLMEEVLAGGIFVQQHIMAFLLRQLIYSRIFLIFFQSAINFVMKDAATDAFKGINPETEDSQNWLIHTLLSGLSRWDARHFLHIAEFGYIWESNLAFFPLFPTILRILGGILHQATGQMISLFSAMLFAGAAFNNCLFVLNGLLLFRLSLILNGGNLKEAILVVYIHCWCPASIFYSSLYTESLYLTLTLLGLLHLHSGGTLTRSHLVVASAIFSLAFLTRSNGLINIGFIGFQLLLDAIIVRRDGQIEFRECAMEMGKRLAKNFAFFLLCFAIMSLPLRVFEFAIRDKFCSLRIQPDNFVDPLMVEYLQNSATGNRQIVLPGDMANSNLHWCNDSSIPSNLLLPSFYPQIQQKYWDVGLFAYWQWKKFPLFLIAAPTLWLTIYGAYQQTFGLLSTDLRPIPEILADRSGQLLFACHAILLAFSGLIFYNVEVSIRLLFSSSPFLYMVIGRIIADQTPNLHRLTDLMNSPIIPFFRLYMRAGWLPMCIFCYLFGFFIFGTMMHVNWFPFV